MQDAQNITCVNSIAERLKHAREEAGLTQPELARRSHVSAGTIGNVESGIRKAPRELLAIARALKVNAEWLKAGKGPKSAEPRGEETMNGWPLTPELLAALHSMDTKSARRVENTLRSMLDMPTLPIEETTTASA